MDEYPQKPTPPGPGPAGPPPAQRLRFSGMTWLLLFLLVLLLLPSVVERVQYAVTRARQRAKADVAKVALEEMPRPSGRFEWVAKRVEPSVVGIETTRLVNGRLFTDEWAYLYPQAGEGSGVIIDEAGYVVTNSHVVENAEQVTVKLSDGRTIRNVEVIGSDPETDLAVLKIGADGLVAAPWGNSDALEVGEAVLAVGNPYRLARTVTAGIISAKERPGMVGSLAHQKCLQTDAAVNPGNSGGPLVNMDGQVVGINTAIVGQSYRGISFAIPSNFAQQVYARLKSTGKVEPRGWLGVAMEEVDYSLAARLDLKDVYGVQVTGVFPGSPADDAGIEPGDVILSWNGQDLHSRAELSAAVVKSRVGSEATVELMRGRERLTVTVTVGRRAIRPQR